MCDKKNLFCYVCGLFVDSKHRIKFANQKSSVEKFNKFYNRAYISSKWYEPDYIYIRCNSFFKRSKVDNNDVAKIQWLFSKPMTWHYLVRHDPDDCYFCQTSVQGFKYSCRENILYADVLSAKKPVLSEENRMENRMERSDEESDSSENEEDNFEAAACSFATERHLVSNNDYKDLIRDLSLSWRQSEILASRLKQWNLVENEFKITIGRKGSHQEFQKMFKADGDDFVYCINVSDLFAGLGHVHKPDEWRLFIDGSCKST